MILSKQLHAAHRRMKLRSKINLFVFLIIMVVLTLVISVTSYLFINLQFKDTGQQALILAKTISRLPQIVNAFQEQDPSLKIQPITEDIQKSTGAEFIVVANMNLIRYSHPIPALIGKSMDPDPGDDAKVLEGQDSISEATGSLGFSVRGKAPIFDTQHHQIGIVSVGFLVSNVWDKIFSFLIKMTLLGVLALAAGFWAAYLLSGHIKKQIFNLEPYEIAVLSKEQAAILESIREGILAVDNEGKITICNQEATRLLGIESDEAVGKYIQSIVPNSRLNEVLEEGVSHYDQPMIIGNTLTIVNRVPITLNHQVIGAVASFRDKIQLDQIDQRLADVGRFADDLRSQRHEFMNKLHTISGLIQMGDYESVLEVINRVNDEHQQFLNFFMTRIRDAAVVGILVGKIHHAKERGISLTVDANSHLSEHSQYQELLVTILGNAIENSIEAIQNSTSKNNRHIHVLINDEGESIQLLVTDTGPGIDPNLKERIFEDGVSTKGPGRGFGLTLISKLVSNAGGHLAIQSSSKGAALDIKLPITESTLLKSWGGELI